jgi:hypothetical protein
MKKYYQLVYGQLSDELLEKAKIYVEKPSSTIVLFLGYSIFTIKKESPFNYIIIEGKKFDTDATLTYITQQFSLPFGEIPEGWKTVGFFDFKEKRDFFELIPFADGWLSIDMNIEIGYEAK